MSIWYADPLDWQKRFIRNRKRFNHIRYGRRSGKTCLIGDLTLEMAARREHCAIALPTAKEYEKRWEELAEYFRPVLRETRVSDAVFIFNTGAKLDWFGMWRADAMRGNHYSRFFADEMAFAPDALKTFQKVIRPTLMDKQGDFYACSTPDGHNDFYLLEETAKTLPDWYCQHGSTYENKYIPKEELDSYKLEVASAVFRQEILAEYIGKEGARIKREWIRYEQLDGNEYTFVMGIDPAISEDEAADYTAAVVIAVPKDKSKPRLILDAQRTRIAQLESVAAWITSIAVRHNVSKLACEQVTFSKYLVDKLRQSLPHVQHIPTKPTKDKLTRFLPLEGQIEHGHVRFHPNLSREYIDEMLSFTGDGKGHDDMVDATVHAEGLAVERQYVFAI